MEDPRAESAVAPHVILKWLPLAAIVVLVGLVLRSAWITEDAYITLRTVDNLVRGFGLRWNIDERVQGFTHPLWMALLSLGYLFTREDFFTTLVAGVLTTIAALLVLVRCARSPYHAFVAVLLLSLSLGFIEFSTSGLENPLTHLLVAVFVLLYVVRERSPDQDIRGLMLCAALLALNRSDAVLVALPALLHVSVVSLRARGLRATLTDIAIGLSPYLAWEAFSIFYYGFPFPNTAYAKLNTSLPANEVKRQGLTYLINSLAWDPPTLIITGLGVTVALAQKRLREGLLALGLFLYLVYVVRIGGDFMLGRFLTLPTFLAVCLIASSRMGLDQPALALAMLAPMALLYVSPSATEQVPFKGFEHSGVADERAFYREGLTLMMYTRRQSLPNHWLVNQGLAARASGDLLRVHGNIGMFGFFAGPDVHIVDPIALTEPLLARLPVRYDPAWRVGHYIRALPPGYFETLADNKKRCLMPDPSLCEYYQKMREVVSGDLWSWSRLQTIAGMNFGSYSYLIDKDRYRFPEQVYAKQQDLRANIPHGAAWDSPGTVTFRGDGIVIALDKPSRASKVSLSLDSNDSYDLELSAGGRVIETLHSPPVAPGGMARRTFETSSDTRSEGFDRIAVRPTGGDNMYSVGDVRLLY